MIARDNRTGRCLEWKPQADITAYELALALPVFIGLPISFATYDSLSSSVKRHFEELFNYAKVGK